MTEAQMFAEIQEKYAEIVALQAKNAPTAMPQAPETSSVTGVTAAGRLAPVTVPESADTEAAQGPHDDDELLNAEGADGLEQSKHTSQPTSPSGGFAGFVKSASSAVLAVLGVGSESKDIGLANDVPTKPSEEAMESSVATVNHAPVDASCSADEADAPNFGTPWNDTGEQRPAAAPVPAAAPEGGTTTLAAQAMKAMQDQVAQGTTRNAPPAVVEPEVVAQQEVLPAVPMPHALACRRKERHHGTRPACRYADSGDPFYPVELDGIVYDSFSLRVVYERDRTGFEETKEFPIRINSIIAARYQVLEYLGSAAFSRAVQCLDLVTGRMVCMKIIKNDKEFLDQSLDEIKLLKLINANADNIDNKCCLALIDSFYHKEHLIIVTELLRDN